MGPQNKEKKMINIIKLLFYLLRELIFDNKEEYDFRSSKFNTRKFIVLILVTMSFVINGWLLYRFISVANEYLRCKTMIEENKVIGNTPSGKDVPPVAKKPLVHPSDSGD